MTLDCASEILEKSTCCFTVGHTPLDYIASFVGIQAPLLCHTLQIQDFSRESIYQGVLVFITCGDILVISMAVATVSVASEEIEELVHHHQLLIRIGH